MRYKYEYDENGTSVYLIKNVITNQIAVFTPQFQSKRLEVPYVEEGNQYYTSCSGASGAGWFVLKSNFIAIPIPTVRLDCFSTINVDCHDSIQNFWGGSNVALIKGIANDQRNEFFIIHDLGEKKWWREYSLQEIQIEEPWHLIDPELLLNFPPPTEEELAENYRKIDFRDLGRHIATVYIKNRISVNPKKFFKIERDPNEFPDSHRDRADWFLSKQDIFVVSDHYIHYDRYGYRSEINPKSGEELPGGWCWNEDLNCFWRFCIAKTKLEACFFEENGQYEYEIDGFDLLSMREEATACIEKKKQYDEEQVTSLAFHPEKVKAILASLGDREITIADSIRVGNCEKGTLSFLARYELPEKISASRLLIHEGIDSMVDEPQFCRVILSLQ